MLRSPVSGSLRCPKAEDIQPLRTGAPAGVATAARRPDSRFPSRAVELLGAQFEHLVEEHQGLDEVRDRVRVLGAGGRGTTARRRLTEAEFRLVQAGQLHQAPAEGIEPDGSCLQVGEAQSQGVQILARSVHGILHSRFVPGELLTHGRRIQVRPRVGGGHGARDPRPQPERAREQREHRQTQQTHHRSAQMHGALDPAPA